MSSFQGELDKWGPSAFPTAADSSCTVVSISQAEAYCRKLACGHYENFPLVSLFLPRKLHQHFYNVYSYCRWADDLGDEIEGAERSLELLSWWREHLQACYAGQATHPVFVALQKTVEEFAIPVETFDDLISAFEQDQRINRYDTFDDVLDYCTRSANPVGRLVLYLCGQANEQTFEWSDSICTGLQLANFWQDVARDLEIDRIYLPAEDMKRYGYSLEQLKARTTNDAFLRLMQFQVERARSYFNPRDRLVACLPFRLQIDIDLFAMGGLKILQRIESINYRVLEQRPVVTKLDAFGMLTGSILRRFPSFGDTTSNQF